MKLSGITLITSTGRTGTMFFQKYITETGSGCICMHEPPPSRIFRLLSNAAVSSKRDSMLPGRLFASTRRRYLKRNNAYVESSNFLFGCIPSLNGSVHSLKVIHLVRHPFSYAGSHLAHGFWRGHKKFFNRCIPYWLEPVNTPLDDPVKVLLSRWSLINRRIARAEATNPYLRIRFEDLFEGGEGSSVQLNEIRNFIGLKPLSLEDNLSWLRKPVNASGKKPNQGLSANDYREFMIERIGRELEEYGYGPC